MADTTLNVVIRGDASSVTAATRTVRRDLNEMQTGVMNTGTAVEQLKSSIAGLVGAAALGALVKASLDAALQMERLTRQFTVFTGSADLAARELAFVKQEANRLGLDMTGLTETYGRFLNAIKGTVNEGEKGRAAFIGISEGMAAVGMTADMQNRAWAQLTQGIMKGKFEMEDLKTINEAGLPIFKLMADALGITTGELLKMQSEGKLMVEDVLPKLGDSMHKAFGQSAVDSANSAQGAINRMNNALMESKAALGDALIPLFTDLLQILKPIIEGIKELIGGLQILSIKMTSLQDKAAGGGFKGFLSSPLQYIAGKMFGTGVTAAQAQASEDEAIAELMKRYDKTGPTGYTAAEKARQAQNKSNIMPDEKAAAAAEKWRATLADLNKEIEQLNPTMNAYEKRLLDINNRYDDLIGKYPEHKTELEGLRQEYIKQLQTSQLAAEVKRKELELETNHQRVMDSIQQRKLQLLGADQQTLAVQNAKNVLITAEETMQNRIATETNPKKAAYMQQELEAQQEVNRLVLQEAEERRRMNNLHKQASEYQELINISKKAGLDTKQLEISQAQVAYDAKRADYAQKIKSYQASGNDLAASTASQYLAQLDTLYAQKDANAANLIKLQEVLGIQTSITQEIEKQQKGISFAKNSAGEDIVVQRTKDEQYKADRELTSNIGEAGHFYGAWFGYVYDAAKQRMADYEREQREKQALLDQESAAQKALADQEKADQAKLALAKAEEQKTTIKAVVALHGAASASVVATWEQQQAAAKQAKAAAAAQQATELQAAAAEQQVIAAEQQAAAVANMAEQTEVFKDAVSSMADQAYTLAESLRAAADNLRKTQTALAGSSTSTLSPEAKYLLAKQQFDQTLAEANATGDAALYNRLPELARAYLAASQGYNASGAGFVSDYTSVQTGLGQAATQADIYADQAEIIGDTLSRMEELLDAIKTALETGGDTANLLTQLQQATSTGLGSSGVIAARIGTSSITGSVAAYMDAVKSATEGTKLSTDAVTAAVGSTTSAVSTGLGTTGALAERIGISSATNSLAWAMDQSRIHNAAAATNTGNTVTGLSGTGVIATRIGTTSTAGSLANLMNDTEINTSGTKASTDLVKTATDLVSSRIGTKTTTDTLANLMSGVDTTLDGSLLNSSTKGRLNTAKDLYTYDPLSTTKIKEVNSSYTYFAKGGIANQASIFGEAGPEAAVPLPDGRTIPVTLFGAADNRDEEIKELRAQTRVLQEGFNQLITINRQQEKRLAGVENKARLAAAA